MAQSFSQIYIHLIFHIKTTSVMIQESEQSRLHAYMTEIIKSMGDNALAIGGTQNHVHILFTLAREQNIADLVKLIKTHTTRWLKNLGQPYHAFAWQAGYAAFSVSRSMVDKTMNYITKQKEHHRNFSFDEEYRKFLDLYGIDYDDKFLLCD